jgi:polyisoprenoid-binding protein YceI
MRKIGLLALFLTGLFANAFANGKGTAEKVAVTISESSLEWIGEKVTGKHEGTIALKEGSLQFKKGELKGGEFVIDVTSLKVTDLAREMAQKLEGHLKSDDFFGVSNHGTANLKITNVVSKGDGKYEITADLTIKGKTNPVSFVADVTEKEGKLETVASIKVDRTKYGIRYGSGSFFDNLGDKAIYDEFTLNVKLVAPKA